MEGGTDPWTNGVKRQALDASRLGLEFRQHAIRIVEVLKSRRRSKESIQTEWNEATLLCVDAIACSFMPMSMCAQCCAFEQMPLSDSRTT